MKRLNRFFMLASLVACYGTAFGQAGWGDECIDPENTEPRSPDHNARRIGNDFILHAVGASGSVTYGGGPGPCYGGARTLDLAGRLGFQIGPVGSLQSTFDDFIALTTGMPRDPAGDFCYAQIISGQPGALTTTLFGDGGLSGQFVGLSNRYMITTWSGGDAQVELRSEVLGDAVRLRWRIRNTTEDTQSIGLKFGAYVGMRSDTQDQFGHNQANSLLGGRSSAPRPTLIPGPNGNVAQSGYVGYIETPTTRPLRTEKNFLRSNPRFPNFVNFQWSQWLPYGLRVDNVPTDEIADATEVEQMLIGSHGILGDVGGILANNNMRGRVSTDFGTGDPALGPVTDPIKEDSDTPILETSFIQVFGASPVAAGQARDIIHYIRSPWSVGSYTGAYPFLIDAPRIVESSPGDLNDLSPNPMTIAAYVDNQYAEVDNSVPLTNVQFTIIIPEGSGLSLAPGETINKTVASIAPNQIGRVTWQVQADGETFGRLPFRVRVQPFNSETKELEASVLVSATPRVRLPEAAVLVTVPWDFADTSLNSIFGPVGDPNALVFGQDFLAYKWDPTIGQYLPVVSARRGESIWIVALNDFGFRELNGAVIPTDLNDGGVTTSLQPGWNMIGNPYPLAVPLSQLIGIGLSDPTRPLAWSQLVDNGWVSPSLAFWERNPDDPSSGFYRFTEGNTDLLQPNRGYWIFVTTPQPIRLSWPPVFLAGVSNTTHRSTSGTSATSPVWRQTDRQWRLQLVARSEEGTDSQNFVGVTTSPALVKSLRKFDPPMSPNGKVDLSISEVVDGRASRLASSFTDSSARKTWNIVAKAEEAGEMVISWPNITSVPRNMRFTLRDVATNTTRDLRFHSSYGFTMDEPGTREFQIVMEPAGTQRALIGNVTVSRPSRDVNGPIAINYSLSTEAMTTIRVLSGGGKEVYRFHRGRSDSAGDNQVTWAMRDSANRAVAPGTYQVEIVAETSHGERVRKIVPVNVVR